MAGAQGVEVSFRASRPGPLGLEGIAVGGLQPGEVPVPVGPLPAGVLPQLAGDRLQPGNVGLLPGRLVGRAGAGRVGLGPHCREVRARRGEPRAQFPGLGAGFPGLTPGGVRLGLRRGDLPGGPFGLRVGACALAVGPLLGGAHRLVGPDGGGIGPRGCLGDLPRRIGLGQLSVAAGLLDRKSVV